MPTLTIELLNPKAQTILEGLEGIGLIAVNQTPELQHFTELRNISTDHFRHQKTVR